MADIGKEEEKKIEEKEKTGEKKRNRRYERKKRKREGKIKMSHKNVEAEKCQNELKKKVGRWDRKAGWRVGWKNTMEGEIKRKEGG